MFVSLPSYPIPHQCHQCSSVNRITLRMFRHVLSLSPPPPGLVPPIFPVYNKLFNSLPYYLNAWNRLTDGQRNFQGEGALNGWKISSGMGARLLRNRLPGARGSMHFSGNSVLEWIDFQEAWIEFRAFAYLFKFIVYQRAPQGLPKNFLRQQPWLGVSIWNNFSRGSYKTCIYQTCTYHILCCEITIGKVSYVSMTRQAKLMPQCIL